VSDRSPGRADVAALAAAAVLALAASLPDLLLRAGEDWRRCREDALTAAAAGAEGGGQAAGGRAAVGSAIARAEGLGGAVANAVFRIDPMRVLGPPGTPDAPEPSRVAGLDGRVADGRLSLRWKHAPGSTGTALRIEGLGGPGVVEAEVGGDADALVLPVPGAVGRIVVHASPVGVPAPGPEARVSIPFRVPVEVVRVERASVAAQSAILVLRRPYDGAPLEAEFALRETDDVGGLSPAGKGGPPVEFLTDFVLDFVRARAGTAAAVPAFLPDGRIRRDGEGLPVTVARPGAEAGVEVVLRGLNDERKVLEAR
jgi:hypothetical protein